MPSLLQNDPFAYTSHRSGHHQSSTKAVATIVCCIHINRGQRSFHCPRHAETTQGAISHMAPTINWSKDRFGCAPSKVKVLHPLGAVAIRVGICPEIAQTIVC